ncbi:hypothetical protein B0H63DRAFT_524849 [Podospora didyma]|uniref:Uncharacterized protein n=1 Tax=Podospora didyma TaxID=330526 RepID=A0AAE0NBG2_9PEZI|nr:hypothetical protein B0H63DRAFT_524849 [Podospora didyma]
MIAYLEQEIAARRAELAPSLGRAANNQQRRKLTNSVDAKSSFLQPTSTSTNRARVAQQAPYLGENASRNVTAITTETSSTHRGSVDPTTSTTINLDGQQRANEELRRRKSNQGGEGHGNGLGSNGTTSPVQTDFVSLSTGDIPRGSTRTHLPSSDGTQEEVERLQRLHFLSRINDYTWSNGDDTIPAPRLFINGHLGHDLLPAAFLLVREAVYYAAKSYWPDLVRTHFPEGVHMVRFGYYEGGWIPDIGVDSDDDTYTPFSVSYVGRLRRSLSNLRDLRNTIYHPDARKGLTTYDYFLCSAQKVTALPDDEARTFEIRAMRGELRREAKKTLEEIEEILPLAIMLPFSADVDLKPHHAKTQSRGYYNSEDLKQSPVTPIVAVAAQL